MRKVIAEIAVSIDGFIEGPKGELDWLVFDEEVSYANQFLSRFDTIFYGRLAYEKFGVPPFPEIVGSEEERRFHETINNMRKYVLTNTQPHVAGNGMVVRNDIESEIKRIRDEEGKDIWLCGGAAVLKTFIDLDLIDEYVLAVQPTVLGSGKPLFGNIKKRLNLALIKSQKLKSGVVVLHYRPQNRATKQEKLW